MSDFQFLVMHTTASGSQVSMYDKVILRKPEHREFFDQDLPLYIPPPIFSRVDNPVDYYYRPEVQHRDGYHPPKLSNENLIGLGRARRPHNAIFVNFDDPEVPSQPLEAAVQNWRKFNTQTTDRKAEEELKRLFEIRPIWSRNAVKSNIDIHPDKLKLLLPFVAYYMVSRCFNLVPLISPVHKCIVQCDEKEICHSNPAWPERETIRPQDTVMSLSNSLLQKVIKGETLNVFKKDFDIALRVKGIKEHGEKLTGPWRSLWVRFGYDPRKDPKAKIYQVLDFRLRCSTKH
eukprot:g42313.t1